MAASYTGTVKTVGESMRVALQMSMHSKFSWMNPKSWVVIMVHQVP
jgi:hypothetical protein